MSAELIADIEAWITHETRPCSCTNGWVRDEGYSPEDYEMGDPLVPGKGLIPCGSCNLGGWNHDEEEPMPVVESDELVLFRRALAALTAGSHPARPPRLLYVSGPYSLNPSRCTDRAIEVGNVLLGAGYEPMVPHLNHFWEERHPNAYEDWMRVDLAWVRRADAVVRIPGESSGADREVALAQSLGIPVFQWCEFAINDPFFAAEFDKWAA